MALLVGKLAQHPLEALDELLGNAHGEAFRNLAD
jgi:hypothetical protein